MTRFDSTIDGVVWPALTGEVDSRRLALAYQLELSQWFSAQAFDELQQMQLTSMLQYHGMSRTDLERLVADAAHEPAQSHQHLTFPNEPDLSVACIWRARSWYGIDFAAPSIFDGIDLRP